MSPDLMQRHHRRIPCGAGALAGGMLPDFRIQAGSSFSLTVKPARFLASAACQAARDTVKAQWAPPPHGIQRPN